MLSCSVFVILWIFSSKEGFISSFLQCYYLHAVALAAATLSMSVQQKQQELQEYGRKKKKKEQHQQQPDKKCEVINIYLRQKLPKK